LASSASLDSDGLTLRLDWRGVVFGLSSRTVSIATAEIRSVRQATPKDARHLLRWRMAGTAMPGWWLMGWFSRATRDRRYAWVWITPKREVVIIETTRRWRSLIIVPVDWFGAGIVASAPAV
jgi:RimJ/RimL family protein N-acetyltransferase